MCRPTRFDYPLFLRAAVRKIKRAWVQQRAIVVMATPANLPKPDLSALRIDDRLRSQSKMGKRIFYASIPVLIFAGIVAAAYAFRNQRPMVEVATAAKPDPGGRQTLLNASGYVTPRRHRLQDYRPRNRSVL